MQSAITWGRRGAGWAPAPSALGGREGHEEPWAGLGAKVTTLRPGGAGVGREEGPGLPAAEGEGEEVGGRVTWAWGRLSQEELGTEEAAARPPARLCHTGLRLAHRRPQERGTPGLGPGFGGRGSEPGTWGLEGLPLQRHLPVGLWCLLRSEGQLTCRRKVIGCWPMAWASPMLARMTSVNGFLMP